MKPMPNLNPNRDIDIWTIKQIQVEVTHVVQRHNLSHVQARKPCCNTAR